MNGEEEIKRYIRKKYPSAKGTLQIEEDPLRTKQVSSTQVSKKKAINLIEKWVKGTDN